MDTDVIHGYVDATAAFDDRALAGTVPAPLVKSE